MDKFAQAVQELILLAKELNIKTVDVYWNNHIADFSASWANPIYVDETIVTVADLKEGQDGKKQ